LAPGHASRVGWSLAPVAIVVVIVALAVPVASITYGELDTTHPQVGAILVQSRGSWFEFCSGTLVSSRVFLTAGHCTDALAAFGFSLSNIKVSFSRDLFAKKAVWLDISAFVTHPDYNWGPTSNPHDLGVLILAKGLTNIPFGALPTENYLNGLDAAGLLADATFTNVGYGTNENIQDTNVRMFSISSFRNLHDAWLYMSQNPHQGNGGTCFGDSGGPTYYTTASGEEVQVAVTSWGDAVCKSTNNNYRVDLPSSLAFIHDMISTYR
jgi:V8-like Glu-specific endopeptidase